jgi:hypothetical protein
MSTAPHVIASLALEVRPSIRTRCTTNTSGEAHKTAAARRVAL